MSKRFNVQLQPKVLLWARKRASFTEESLADRMKVKPEDVSNWEKTGVISFSQAKKLAQKTHTPFGCLYLEEPLEDKLPIKDFRVVGSKGMPKRPSPELIDVIDDAFRKQAWYRNYLLDQGKMPLEFISSIRLGDDPSEVADTMREQFKFEEGLKAASWKGALIYYIRRLEEFGVLVIRANDAGGGNQRPLMVNEFKGFALVDDYAPIIFINSKDYVASMIFTLMHELVHLWLGESGVSLLEKTLPHELKVERFCNSVAAEILVPKRRLIARLQNNDSYDSEVLFENLCRVFKVSKLVILRRLFDIGKIDYNHYTNEYERIVQEYKERLLGDKERGITPKVRYYTKLKAKSSERFASALVASALEGRTSYRDAMHLLGTQKAFVFERFASELGFSV